MRTEGVTRLELLSEGMPLRKRMNCDKRSVDDGVRASRRHSRAHNERDAALFRGSADYSRSVQRQSHRLLPRVHCAMVRAVHADGKKLILVFLTCQSEFVFVVSWLNSIPTVIDIADDR